jgi:cyclophilin family peptidyl-prolyl cis-trans isomerase/HEAT repeat protein
MPGSVMPFSPRAARARARIATLAAALLLAACAPGIRPGAGQPEGPRIVRLDDRAAAALAELLSMEDRRALDVARMTALLGDPTPEVRARAALATGRVKEPGSAHLVRPLLADPDPHVRAAAAFAAGLLADTAALPALRTLALQAAGGDGVEAVAALWRIGTPDAAAVVEQILAESVPGASRRPPPRARTAEALLAVWRMPRSAQAVRHVVQLAGSADEELRWRASHALMRMGEPGTALPLLELLRAAPDPLSRAQAARGLRPAFADSAGIAAEVGQALRAALADPHPHVRINAVRAFAGFAAAAADVDDIARLLADPDSNVVLATVETLAAPRLASMAAPALRSVAGNAGARTPVRLLALNALVRAGDAQALDIAAAWLDSPEASVRLAAARALAPAGAAAAAPLERAARDRDPRVAAAALAARAALPESAAPARSLLLEALRNPAPAVRAAAARALAPRAMPEDMPALLDAYDAALADPAPDAALAVIDALGSLAEAGAPVDRTFFARFPQPHPDRAVHARALARLGPGRWPDAPPAPPRAERPLRPLEWYHQIIAEHVAPPLAGQPLPRVAIELDHGTIVLELAPHEAPITVASFLDLVGRGFYDGLPWHRVVPNFVLQTGQGPGGPAFSIRDELNRLRYLRGTLGMALSGPDTGTSQWFITHAPQPHLDGGYTIFGRVIEGMEAADAVVQEDVIRRIRLLESPGT